MTSPWPDPDPNPLPGAPTVADDPTGLRYDRGDLDQTTTATAGDGWAVTGRGRHVEQIDTPTVDEHLTHVHPLPAFNLRGLARVHLTAAEWERIERGAA